MKNTLLILFILANTFCTAQTIKNYSGPYEDGKITYQYYENESFERIYQGSYIYSCKKHIEWIGEGHETIKGNFINNFQNGSWNYSFKSSDKKSNVSIKGSYKDGLMDGIWTKTISNLIKKTTRQKMIANFKEGKLIGDFYFAQNSDTIKGKFNDNSHFEGKWVVKYKDFRNNDEPCEIVYNFNDGLLTFVLNRSLASGKIFYKNDNFETEYLRSSSFYGSLQYILEITDKLRHNNISNGYLLNYGTIDDGSKMFSQGLKKIDYDTLLSEQK